MVADAKQRHVTVRILAPFFCGQPSTPGMSVRHTCRRSVSCKGRRRRATPSSLSPAMIPATDALEPITQCRGFVKVGIETESL